MKKIIATALCLTITSPCFAGVHYGPAPAPMPRDMHRPPVIHYEQRFHNTPPRYYHHNEIHRHRAHERTRVLGAVAGIAGAAMIISAIVD